MNKSGHVCWQVGLTLVELLITLGVAILVGALLLTIMVNTLGLFYKESSTRTQGLSINDALSKIRSSVKQSSIVATSFTSGTTYTSSVTQLVLKITSVDLSGNLITNTFDYFVFFLDGSNLRFKTFPDVLSSRKAQDQIFSTNVKNLQFKYLDLQNPPLEVLPSEALKVRVSLTLQQKSGADYETIIATSEASLRND